MMKFSSHQLLLGCFVLLLVVFVQDTDAFLGPYQRDTEDITRHWKGKRDLCRRAEILCQDEAKKLKSQTEKT